MRHWIVWAIEKCILSSRMTVEIHIDKNSMLSLNFSSQSLNMQNFRVELFLKCHKLSVQIFSSYAGSGISQNNSIWIEHRNYKEVDIGS